MKINELDLAQLKHEFREMYKDIGYRESLRVAYELITSFNVLLEVIDEEVNHK